MPVDEGISQWGATIVKVRVQSRSDNGPLNRSTRPSFFNRDNAYTVKPNGTSKSIWKKDRRSKSKQKLSKWQVFSIVRRLLVITAACHYINISMVATWRTIQVSRYMSNPTRSFEVFTAQYIAGYVEDGLISDSKLVREVLKNDTTPRDFVLFLESDTKVSVEGCSQVPLFDSNIYNHAYLTQTYEEIVRDTSYNTTMLTELELIAVVVDCSSTQLEIGDPSTVRVFNLARSRNDSADVYLVTVSLSVQSYEMWTYKKLGPAVAGMITVIHDMQADITKQIYMLAQTYPYQRSMEFEIYDFIGITGESYRELQSIPRDPRIEPAKRLITSRKRGFYDGDIQSNIHSTYSVLDVADAKSALTRWEWLGETIIKDSWVWVHAIHLFFGIQTIFSLMVVGLVMYQNYRAGKIWIGDPFASVSTATLVGRGLLVLLSWYVNSFWTIFEFAMSNAAVLSGSEAVHIYNELAHADEFVIYLGLVAFLSWVFCERINPSVAVFLFEATDHFSLNMIRDAPSILKEIITYSSSVFRLGIPKKSPEFAAMSPMNFWSTFQVPSKDVTFLAASFFPNIILLTAVMLYAIMRKVYRRYDPEQAQQRSARNTNQSARSANHSANEATALALKGNLTNFEISTGAELQTRYGIISDYNNYVYFKGMKFASADGVYCSGYVIVNSKFLMKSEHLLAVALMKLMRARITNVYAYEVQGNTVMNTARLVYPETFTWTDLWHLNVSVLL